MNTEMEYELITVMEEAGMIVHHMVPEERARLRVAAAPVWDQFADTIDSEIFNMALAIRYEHWN